MNPECGAFFNPCFNFLVTSDNCFDSLVIKKASAREWGLKLKKFYRIGVKMDTSEMKPTEF